MTASTDKPRMPLHWKIAIGFGAGLLLGLLVHYGIGADAPWVQSLTKYVTQPFGTLFLSLIFMLIVPLLFSALVVGVSEMGDVRALGRVGWRTLAYTVLLSGRFAMPTCRMRCKKINLASGSASEIGAGEFSSISGVNGGDSTPL